MDDMIVFPSCYKQPDQITTALTPQTVHVPKADLLKVVHEALDDATGHISSELLNPTFETDDLCPPQSVGHSRPAASSTY